MLTPVSTMEDNPVEEPDLIAASSDCSLVSLEVISVHRFSNSSTSHCNLKM